MYQVGDLIIYGSTGVCNITAITTLDYPRVDKSKLYYELKPFYQNGVIYAPVNTTKVYMRPIISRDEVEKLISMIPEIRAEAYHNRILSQLAEHYQALLSTHNCLDLLELSMSLYAKKQLAEQQNRMFGAIDKRFMKRAEDLLFGELSASLNIPKDKIPEYIADRVDHKWREYGNEFD